ncbi:MAG: ABC transporter permease [Gammaproteobacteria bacterium]
MKFFGLVWAMLWRSRARTVLTLLSLVTAFLLLGLIQAANSLFSGEQINLSAPILITQARVSFTSPLPMRLIPQVEAVPGVASVSHSQFFGGIYQDNPQNFFPQFAVNPERWIRTFPECVLSSEQERAFRTTRTGAIIGPQLAQRFGWKVGDKIPLKSQIWPQKSGDRAWEFDVVGIFGSKVADSCARVGNMYVNYAYFDEARQFGNGMAGIIVVRIANPDDAQQVGNTIDAMFENSPDETKTQTERDFSLNFVRQIGNLKLILYSILGAVFFAILMLTGNTMLQAVQDRIPELAVLKTIGFTDGQVLGLVLGEALFLVVLGGLTGMLLSMGAMYVLANAPGINFPPMNANAQVWLFAAAAMVLLSLAVGLWPALRAWRLSIVDALAGR